MRVGICRTWQRATCVFGLLLQVVRADHERVVVLSARIKLGMVDASRARLL